MTVPRIALTRTEAAESLGMGLTFFETQVQPELRIIRRGSKRLIPVSELERWVSENAQRTLDGHAR
jgi:excisionase family DNA binding protein